MRKLLNTLYVTNEQAYLELDGGNIVCRIEGKQVFRVPFDNIEAIVQRHRDATSFKIFEVPSSILRSAKRSACVGPRLMTASIAPDWIAS